ncbi:MAG: polyhydroxyalkanoic acid system family protein [Myxococcales bacterium]|nr:polyhydroxyalkanoic acid system family protein [Myxococcales bacterium]
MQHRIPHDLSDDLAKAAVGAAIRSYSERFEKYHVTASWVTEQRASIKFNIKGKALEGFLSLTAGAVVFEMDVPLLLRPFSGPATAKIEEHVQRWIQRAKDGELPGDM